ncbi:MAG: MFS transporter [Acidimicrobiales bacterium]
MNRFTREERAALVAGMLAASLVPLNSTMIAVGLPAIGTDLSVRRATTAILVTVYLVAMALLQPFTGRWGDRVGPRRAVTVGLIGFALSSGLGAASPGFAILLVTRAAQAVFGAALIPNVQAIIRGLVAEERRGRAFGTLGAGIGAGAAAGPVIGGLLIEVTGWRGIFVVSVQVALAALVTFSRLDGAGARIEGPRVIGGAGVLASAPFRAACGVQAASNFSQYAVLLVIPLALDAMGWSGGTIGLVLSGMTIGLLVLSPVGGTIGDRIGRRRPVVIGTTTGLVGVALMAAVGLTATPALIAGVVILGLGMGFASASLQTAALESVPANAVGGAAGIMSTSRYVGSISSTIAIAVFVGDGTSGVRAVLTAGVVAAALAIVAATRIADRPPVSEVSGDVDGEPVSDTDDQPAPPIEA